MAVTPNDYQPPGFKEGSAPDCLIFNGDPVNLKVGTVSTGFHELKVRVTTESKRMGMLESSMAEEKDSTEISHQGLDCDEEEEESSTKIEEQVINLPSCFLDPGGCVMMVGRGHHSPNKLSPHCDFMPSLGFSPIRCI